MNGAKIMNTTNFKYANNSILDLNTHGEVQNLEFELIQSENKRSRFANEFPLIIKLNNSEYRFSLYVKKYLTGNGAHSWLKDMLKTKNKKDIIILSEYMTPKIVNYLQGNDISFINKKGNVFIKKDDLVILFKYPKNNYMKNGNSSVFTVNGLKMIFHILSEPELINKTYDEISKTVGIAKGSISKIVSNLKKSGFFYQRNKKRILRNKKELLDQWVFLYGKKLRPELLIGIYRKNEQKNKINLPDNCWWAGEKAAEKMNLNMKAQHKTIYIKTEPVKLIKKLKLLPDQNGDIEILHSFWKPEYFNEAKNNIAPPIVVYADLVLSKSDRNKEIAEVLYEKNVQNNW